MIDRINQFADDCIVCYSPLVVSDRFRSFLLLVDCRFIISF